MWQIISIIYTLRQLTQGARVENDHIVTIKLEDRRNKKLRGPDALLLI